MLYRTEFTLTNCQKRALSLILDFIFNSNEQFFVLSGSAGTGKTTLLKIINDIVNEHHGTTRVMSFTGKAASVLRSKGIPAHTLHSILYTHKWNRYLEKYEVIKNSISELYNSADLFVVDEAGNPPSEVLNDLIETGRKILFVGDKNQLPPPTDDKFTIMDYEHYHMTEITRQDAKNPIILMAREILDTGRYTRKYVDNNHIRILKRDLFGEIYNKDQPDIALCGINRVRISLNTEIRRLKGIDTITYPYPVSGESVMCLNNGVVNDGTQLFNGEIYKTQTVNKNYKHVEMSLVSTEYEDEDDAEPVILTTVKTKLDDWINREYKTTNADIKGNIFKFDFSYAITVHKSQGSEFNNVFFLDEDVSHFIPQRNFRYTAITRAKENITIFN